MSGEKQVTGHGALLAVPSEWVRHEAEYYEEMARYHEELRREYYESFRDGLSGVLYWLFFGLSMARYHKRLRDRARVALSKLPRVPEGEGSFPNVYALCRVEEDLDRSA